MPDIVLKGIDSTVKYEDEAGSALTPGELLTFDGSGDLIPHNNANGDATPIFHVPGPAGQDIDTDTPSGSNAHYRHCPSGVKVYAWLADEANVSKGDELASDGAGALQAWTDQTVNEGGTATVTVQSEAIVAKAAESVDNTGGTGPVRIEVVVM